MLKEDYVTTVDGNITEVRCKGCGNVIRKLVVDGSFGAVERVRGQTIVRERLALTCLPNYREALIQLEDGSKHVTCICDACVPRLDDPAQAQAMYQKDLDQFEKEGAVYTRKQRARQVTSVLKVAAQIGV